MKPKYFSPNVESLVGEIGNEIHKPKKVVNIITSKRSLQKGPGVLVVTHIMYSTGDIYRCQSPSPVQMYSVALSLSERPSDLPYTLLTFFTCSSIGRE